MYQTEVAGKRLCREAGENRRMGRHQHQRSLPQRRRHQEVAGLFSGVPEGGHAGPTMRRRVISRRNIELCCRSCGGDGASA
ncbi:MAG: hypothetical protein ACLUIQ_11590 [Dialister invisus]